jgi:putative membrane protein insertion efficiency factor
MKHVGTFLWLLPRNTCVAILRGYRAVISPLYGDVCRYYPSCSAYTMGAIQQHGVIKGVVLGAWRILRCHPWAKGGIDDVPESRRHHAHYHLTRFGFVAAGHGKG